MVQPPQRGKRRLYSLGGVLLKARTSVNALPRERVHLMVDTASPAGKAITWTRARHGRQCATELLRNRVSLG